MGWDVVHAKHYYKNGQVNRKKNLDEYISWENDICTYRVVKSSMKGSTYYAAVAQTDKDNGEKSVFAVVILTKIDSRDYFNLYYKVIIENYGPCECDCPKGILDLLTPTDSEYADKWREKCRRNLERTRLSDLPVGTKIKFTIWNGEEIELIKRAPAYQFRRNWWYRESNNTYFKSKYIPENFEIAL